MCQQCFYEYTDAPVVNDRVLAVRAMLDEAGDDAHWGFLHVIVEDDNVGDEDFDLTGPDSAWRAEGYAQAEAWERAIFDAMAALTEAERATAVALHGGYCPD